MKYGREENTDAKGTLFRTVSAKRVHHVGQPSPFRNGRRRAMCIV